MADYRSCAWYQKATCIRYDKSGAPISCADCEDYERRVVFKIEDLQERNGEMSVRKSCENCKYSNHEKCDSFYLCGENKEYWELADDAKADVLHDATDPDQKNCENCAFYWGGYCNHPELDEKLEKSEDDYCTAFINKLRRKRNNKCNDCKEKSHCTSVRNGVYSSITKCGKYVSEDREVGQYQNTIKEQIANKCLAFSRQLYDDLYEVISLIGSLDYEQDINKAVDMVADCFRVDRGLIMPFVIQCKKNKLNRSAIAADIFIAINKRNTDMSEHDSEQEHDAVNHPNHYCKGGVECLDAIKAALGDKYEGFLIGNVIKYCYRYRNKNGVEDLRKSKKYLEWAIQELEKDEKK